MPIYEYTCTNCGISLEYLVLSINKDKLQDCPVCDHKMKRVISAPNFKLKDGKSGWAKDGYGDKNEV